MIDYAGFEVKKDKTKTVHNTIAVGAQAIITKNLTFEHGSVYNGQRVTVTDCFEQNVSVVDEKGNKFTFGYVEEKEGDNTIERYMPVSVCYALTIHKSQGQTVDSLIVHVDELFEQGMAYVALSRCTDLNKVQIIGNLNFADKGW